MNPIHTPDCNFRLLPPSGETEESVGTLHCRRTATGFTSYWQPDEFERQTLAAGGLVVLESFGSSHPPARLTASPSPEQREEFLTLPRENLSAGQINSLLCSHRFFMMGVAPECPDLSPLADIPLAELVAAVAELREKNAAAKSDAEGRRTVTTVAADVAVAEAYVFLHRQLRPEDPGQENLFHDGRQFLLMVRAETEVPS